MTDLNTCELLVGGRIYGGWLELAVERSIEQIAGSFDLQLTARWPGVDVTQGLREGLPCQVRLGGETVVTGYLDSYEPSLTSRSTSIRVNGRCKTGDLVDCSAIHKTGAWRGVKLDRIVRDIVAPFGLSVEVGSGVDLGEVFKRFALEDGERAFDAIDRACRLRAVLCTSTPEGNVLLTVASDEASGVTLQEGINIERIQAVHSWKERHSEIIVKAQTPGDDDEFGTAAAALKSTAKDAEINRYRPLVVMAEHHTSSRSLADRAAWEVKVRMGRGKRGRLTVVGWRTGKDGMEGSLWKPNTLVRVISDRMNLDADMLIVACSYQLGASGLSTELTFVRREAFELVEGASRPRLGKRLSDRTNRDKTKRGDGFTSSWDLTPPQEPNR